MPIAAWVLLYLAAGVVTAFVIMFLSNLRSWGVDSVFIPAFIVMWPLCISFAVLCLFISWIENAAKKAADAFEDWRDSVRYKAREREREIELEQTTRRMEEARARRAARGKKDGSSN